MTRQHHIQLCRLDEIAPDTARGFTTVETGAENEIFVVNKDGKYFGYQNSCPHRGAPLEWMPNEFLSLDREHIQCSLHGARFTIEQGLCIHGPCLGHNLTPISISIEDNLIFWNNAASEKDSSD